MLIQRRAIALLSGGLDSLLAAKVVKDQGIHVEGVNFYTGFCVEGHTRALRKHHQNKSKRHSALWSAEQLGIKLHIVDISEEYREVLTNPKHGYGAHLNPCLDCKIFMVKQANIMVNRARQLASQKGFDFIITGEVVGQRPNSQRSKNMLPLIASESGAHDRLLRPLSAKNLPETLPERMGWIDRSKLYGFYGRNRTPQIKLAKSLGFEEYNQPAGGCCFLTDKAYSAKLADLWQAKGNRTYDLDDIVLLKLGRHFRPSPNFKVIIGREEGENRFLEGYRKRFTHLVATNYAGPLALVDGTPTQDDLTVAARLVARYSQGRSARSVDVAIGHPNQSPAVMSVTPFSPEEIPHSWAL